MAIRSFGMRAAALVALLLLSSCGPTRSSTLTNRSPSPPAKPAQSASGTPSANPGTFAVLEKDFLVEGGPLATISIVRPDGTTAATTMTRKRSVGVQIGNLSTSASRVYYLDGDSAVRSLSPDGSSAAVTTIKLGPHQVATFAVTPDDRRIAVSILDFTHYPVSTRLYVENFDGSQHVELFSSATVMEWPAGWHEGELVMAIGINAPPQNAFEGFARGRGYHVVDAETANRLLNICDGGDSYQPEVPAGTVCVQWPKASIMSWDGRVTPLVANGCPQQGPLAPDGGFMAGRACDGSGQVILVDAQGKEKPMTRRERPEGWLDKVHLVLVGDFAPYDRLILDISDGSTVPVSAGGFFAAALPGGL